MASKENISFSESENARVKDEMDRLAQRGRIEEDDRQPVEELPGTGGGRSGIGRPRKHSALGPQETLRSKKR